MLGKMNGAPHIGRFLLIKLNQASSKSRKIFRPVFKLHHCLSHIVRRRKCVRIKSAHKRCLCVFKSRISCRGKPKILRVFYYLYRIHSRNFRRIILCSVIDCQYFKYRISKGQYSFYCGFHVFFHVKHGYIKAYLFLFWH